MLFDEFDTFQPLTDFIPFLSSSPLSADFYHVTEMSVSN
jgi:hypothetical protein